MGTDCTIYTTMMKPHGETGDRTTLAPTHPFPLLRVLAVWLWFLPVPAMRFGCHKLRRLFIGSSKINQIDHSTRRVLVATKRGPQGVFWGGGKRPRKVYPVGVRHEKGALSISLQGHCAERASANMLSSPQRLLLEGVSRYLKRFCSFFSLPWNGVAYTTALVQHANAFRTRCIGRNEYLSCC